MAKTGDATRLGTAEGALLGRAAHALHAPDPVLDDPWAVELLLPREQRSVRDAEVYRQTQAPDRSPTSRILAISLGSLRYAEDEVERCWKDGIRQYVILGAGFDTFGLRRADLDGLRVYEVDHPDVQALKRERVAAASIVPERLPEYVPVDFEATALGEALRASPFDPGERSVFSWMNTLPYLTPEATAATLAEIAGLMAPGSRLVLNYHSTAPLTDEQREFLDDLKRSVASQGEPFQSRWEPAEFESLLARNGLAIAERADDGDLSERYFAGRSDGMLPGVPASLITAERRAE
ncbi:MAG: class I SAM-dependent methyltransferase [Proteobacteria bacterium]|nr:class I SAM-dependent methyltransferase [Pseudomonadota bacterium]